MRAPRISRREFLRKAGQAGLGLGLGSHLVAIAGCSGGSANLVAETPGGYDAIVVGGGAAGAIVAAKLQIASGGRKRILIIEAGGPTSAAIGGTDFPVWLPPNRTDLTIHDVPGEYSLLAFQPLGAPVPAHRDAVHMAGNRSWRQRHVQRDAVSDQPVGSFRQ